MKCKKIDRRIECISCEYPYSEARYPDTRPSLDCNSSEEILNEHIKVMHQKYEWL